MVIVTLLSCALFGIFPRMRINQLYSVVKSSRVNKDSEFYPSECRVVTTKLATRMARLRRVNEYAPEKETIPAYLERVDMFFLVNDICEEKKVPVLLSVIGATTYALLRNYPE